jgi:hypothetical protein
MDTNTTHDVIVNAYPSPKEQVVSLAIQLGFAAASTVIVFGSLAAIGYVVEARADRKSRKEAQLNKIN